MASIKLFIVDDHSVIISGIRSMLKDVPDIEIIGMATDGEEALRNITEENLPDVVLMDIKMPKLNGIETTRKLLEKFPDLPVMALTMFDDEEYVVTMIQAGARGYVLKNTDKEELILAIQRVAQGETYYSQEATSVVMQALTSGRKSSAEEPAAAAGADEPAGDGAQLTRREIEILRLIAAEMTNQEIADKLYISPRTVHSHRRNLMQKVGVKNTAGLVRYALEHNMT